VEGFDANALDALGPDILAAAQGQHRLDHRLSLSADRMGLEVLLLDPPEAAKVGPQMRCPCFASAWKSRFFQVLCG
jgi:hypothetical protein